MKSWMLPLLFSALVVVMAPGTMLIATAKAQVQTRTVSCGDFSADVPTTRSRVIVEVNAEQGITCRVDNSADLPLNGLGLFIGPDNSPDTYDFFARATDPLGSRIESCQIAGVAGRGSGARCSVSTDLPSGDPGPDHLHRATATLGDQRLELTVVTRSRNASSFIDVLSAFVSAEVQAPGAQLVSGLSHGPRDLRAIATRSLVPEHEAVADEDEEVATSIVDGAMPVLRGGLGWQGSETGASHTREQRLDMHERHNHALDPIATAFLEASINRHLGGGERGGQFADLAALISARWREPSRSGPLADVEDDAASSFGGAPFSSFDWYGLTVQNRP